MGTQGPKRLCTLNLLAINQIVYQYSLNSKLLYITELIEESSWKIDFFSCFPLPPYACPVTNLHMHSLEKSIISASTLPFEILSPLPCPVIFVVKIFALSLPGHSFSSPPPLTDGQRLPPRRPHWISGPYITMYMGMSDPLVDNGQGIWISKGGGR